MINGAIFDMDGLMLDTERLALYFWQEAGRKLGVEISREFIDGFRGKNMAAIGNAFYEKYGSGFDFDLCCEYKLQNQYQYIEAHGVPVKKGLVELLNYLWEHKIHMAVATSTDRKLADTMLKKADVAKYFDTFVYGDMVERSKPNPDIFLKAAEELNLSIENCMILEDSIAGVEAGKRAGGFVIHVPDVIVVPDEVKEGIAAEMEDLEQVIFWVEQKNQSV